MGLGLGLGLGLGFVFHCAALVASTTVSIIDLVPVSKEAISKTPIGPFQMMVFEAMIAAALRW